MVEQQLDPNNVIEIASQIDAEIRALPLRNTPKMRAVRRKCSRKLKDANLEFILDLARELLKNYDYRWLASELIRGHTRAFQSLGEAELEELARVSTAGGLWTRLRAPCQARPGSRGRCPMG